MACARLHGWLDNQATPRRRRWFQTGACSEAELHQRLELQRALAAHRMSQVQLPGRQLSNAWHWLV